MGRFVSFSADTVCHSNGSCLVFGDVSIETDDDPEDEDEDDSEYDDEGDE